MPRFAFALIALACIGCAGVFDRDVDAGGLDAGQAFARMQKLEGRWLAKDAQSPAAPPPAPVDTKDAAKDATKTAGKDAAKDSEQRDAAGAIPIEYSVTAGGHVVQERLFAGMPDEMFTLYYLEARDLAAVHYCSMGNRPHLRLDRRHSTIDDLHFEWDGSATDIDPRKDAHIHAGRIHFVDPQTVETEWAFWADGKESARHSFALTRAPAAAPVPAPDASTKPSVVTVPDATTGK